MEEADGERQRQGFIVEREEYETEKGDKYTGTKSKRENKKRQVTFSGGELLRDLTQCQRQVLPAV